MSSESGFRYFGPQYSKCISNCTGSSFVDNFEYFVTQVCGWLLMHGSTRVTKIANSSIPSKRWVRSIHSNARQQKSDTYKKRNKRNSCRRNVLTQENAQQSVASYDLPVAIKRFRTCSLCPVAQVLTRFSKPLV